MTPDKPAEQLQAQALSALVVEDTPADVQLMLHRLRASGYDATADVVQTAEEFTQQIRNRAYDVVLADYNLPQWNGMEAIQLLRHEGLDIPVIVVSGAIGEHRAVECIKQGAADYVLKDHLTRLPESVRRAINEKSLREERNLYLEELARSNRDLEQFAYVASHDLQEPLRMVATYTQLLAARYQGKIDDTADKYIRYAVDGAIRMQSLIQDLLAFSRVGRQGTQLQDVQCRAIVELAAKNLELAIKESGAQLVYDKLPVVTADRSQLLISEPHRECH